MRIGASATSTPSGVNTWRHGFIFFQRRNLDLFLKLCNERLGHAAKSPLRRGFAFPGFGSAPKVIKADMAINILENPAATDHYRSGLIHGGISSCFALANTT